MILAAQWDSTPTNIGLDEFDEALASRLTATTHTGGAKKKRCAKVVQTEMSVGVLLFIDSKYVFLVGKLPCLLQVVDPCSSECYDAVLKRQLYLPLLEQLRPHFEISVNCGTADRDSANVKLQRHWATRFIQRHHLFLRCQIHNLSTCCGNSLQVLDGDVSGCLSLGLSMEHAGAVALCRTALQSAVEKHLDLFPNVPAPRHNDPSVYHKLRFFDLVA